MPARLPQPRGEVTEQLVRELALAPHSFEAPQPDGDPMAGDDFHLALYLCYELHYRGFEEVDERWEWEPSLIGFRRGLEDRFEEALRAGIDIAEEATPVATRLRSIVDDDPAPSLSGYLQHRGSLDEFREFVIHRSAYQLKEADPHSWLLPRLWGKPKAAMAEIQGDEYGGGDADRIHARLFASTMTALGLDPSYGAYLDQIPGVTLATVNLMSLFGLNRRLRGAGVGHLALFEMTSSIPNGRYAAGLRRLEQEAATDFFDEHVEADAVHEMIAVHDMAGALAAEDPSLTQDILFGAQAVTNLEGAFARHLLGSWDSGRSSLLPGVVAQPAL